MQDKFDRFAPNIRRIRFYINFSSQQNPVFKIFKFQQNQEPNQLGVFRIAWTCARDLKSTF